MTDVAPIAIARIDAATILIEWSDGAQLRYRADLLRKQCPCATCREKKSGEKNPPSPKGLPVLSIAEARPLSITGMRPVGNYGYAIAFSDGHDSGIFTFDMLRTLGKTEA